MTYNDWLEKELNIYKRENKLLNEKIDSLADIYVNVGEKSKKLQEHNDKKNDILKWAYSLEKENKELKEELNTYTPNEVYKIVKENKQLKSDINYHFNLKMEYLLENQKLKQELFDIYKEK